MAMGKPVIGYLLEEDLHLIPPAMRTQFPLSRAYLERWHEPVKITADLKLDYDVMAGRVGSD